MCNGLILDPQTPLILTLWSSMIILLGQGKKKDKGVRARYFAHIPFSFSSCYSA